LLDEATSALDAESERAASALNDARATIVIASTGDRAARRSHLSSSIGASPTPGVRRTDARGGPTVVSRRCSCGVNDRWPIESEIRRRAALHEATAIAEEPRALAVRTIRGATAVSMPRWRDEPAARPSMRSGHNPRAHLMIAPMTVLTSTWGALTELGRWCFDGSLEAPDPDVQRQAPGAGAVAVGIGT
jgi:hypothetical protein